MLQKNIDKQERKNKRQPTIPYTRTTKTKQEKLKQEQTKYRENKYENN